MAQKVKRLPAMQETGVRSLGQEEPLEKEMATHSSTLVWKIPWTEKLSIIRKYSSTSSSSGLSGKLGIINWESSSTIANIAASKFLRKHRGCFCDMQSIHFKKSVF